MYDVLVNDLLQDDFWYSLNNFKTYYDAKSFVRTQIKSNYCNVFIRKLSKKCDFIPRWRIIDTFSTEYYRLNILNKSYSDYFDKKFGSCVKRFNYAK